MKELLNKEVIIIDGEEYVKVALPKGPEGAPHPGYLYVPVDEYLAKADTYTPTSPSAVTPRSDSVPVAPGLSGSPEKEVVLITPSPLASERLRLKVVLTHFDDRSVQGDETYGDWMAEKLVEQLNHRSQRILFVDYQLVAQFLKREGYGLADLESAEVLRLLGQAFGIHAVISGQVLGPYVFTSKGVKGREETSKAILKVEVTLLDTVFGKRLKTFSVTNPVTTSREQGSFSEEKAKVKAIELALETLSKGLARELDRMDWFCRVAMVEGDEIYLPAGRLTGLRIGDVMEVHEASGPEKRKGKVQISGFLGVDASAGRLIDGKRPDVNDLLRPFEDKGT